MSAAVFKRSLPFSSALKVRAPVLVSRHTPLYNQFRTMASTTQDAGKPPFPPFTLETARIKVKAAQDLWNTRYVVFLKTEVSRVVLMNVGILTK
jgi:hypothetical protein